MYLFAFVIDCVTVNNQDVVLWRINFADDFTIISQIRKPVNDKLRIQVVESNG